ncbi:MAG: hypothetical protein COA96_15900 [SAR86 cluster bacterium]|uniref:Uncharacterized protein n=1 Tax=SAR86 cluster bacterium TaxID=2030880 RepID=A0A2A5AN39_9GAMM|nr:MAG: hypothetical protein COA96_15900 [SAR86 cluster bacterium]
MCTHRFMTANVHQFADFTGSAKALIASLLIGLVVNFALSSAVLAQTAGPGCNETTTTAFSAVAGELVQLVSCTEELQQGNNTTLTIDVPTGIQVGDFLVFVMSTDGTAETINNPANFSADWTPSGTYLGTPGITSEVFTRIVDGTEAAAYTFNWNSTEQYYTYMMRFSGASGLYSIGTNTGISTIAVTPGIVTNAADALILKLLNVDFRPFAVFDETAVVTGMTTPNYNITEGSSRATGGGGGATVSGASLYYYQAAQGATVAGNFTVTNSQEWHTRTMAIEPIEFRISMPDTSAAVCGIQDVTLSVTDSAGTPLSWFQGTVTLNASNGTSSVWSDAGALAGTLNDLGSGVATYQFDAGDGGVATFSFYNPSIGLTNFDIDYAGLTGVENSTFDPNLTITSCIPEVISPSCAAGNSNTITIGAQNAISTLRGRMVLLAVGLEGTGEVTAATFDVGGANIPMTLIYEELNLNGLGNITELWGILDANLPVGAGTYTVNFATTDPDPSMCVLYTTKVEQVFPGPSSGATGADPVNGSQAQNTANAVTSITTTADNALVISLVGNGSGGSDYPAATSVPVIPMTELFDAPDPGGGAEFEASSGILSTAGLITVTESWSGGAPNRHSHVVASFNPLPLVAAVPTEIRMFHSTESDVCSLEAITISITDAIGSLASNFIGTITVTNNSAGAGVWTVNDATNALVDNGSGSVDYTFALADGGDIVLNFELLAPDAAVDFEVTSAGLTPPSGAFDPLLEIVTCTAEIDVNATTNVCSISESVTLTIRNRNGGVANGSIGTIVLNNDTNNGDYISTTGAGTLDNGAADDGIATYVFDVTDAGTVDIEFSTGTVETLDFSALSTYIAFDAGASSENLDVLACEFRIAHTGNTDVCSVESVTISVFNSAAAAVTDYLGAVNLSTSTGNGTWTLGSGNGSVTDPVSEDGNATYEFVALDSGSVTLFFTNTTNETLNINVSDGVTTDSNASFDPNLTVAVCTFQITMVDEEMDACSSENITITVYDSLAAIATNYTGTVSFSTDTLHGTWADAGALQGILTDSAADDGLASYQFDAADNGVAVFTFTDPNNEIVNIDLIDGVIIEDGSFDPNLEVAGCFPGAGIQACFPGTGPGTGNLTIGAADPGRMVVMVIFHVDGTPQNVTDATFDGVSMTQIHEITGANTSVEMWGILDVNLPAGAGAYAGAYTFDAAPANNPSMCMLELSDVAQAFPGVDLGTPVLGQANANFFVPDGAPNDMATSVTTNANNAFILTAGLSDFTQAPDSWFNDVDPNPPMSQYFFNTNDQNPASGTAGGSIGNKAVAGLITVIDTDVQDAFTSSAHIVASFNPLVAGSPQASGFVPVLLFESLSGNIAYKAIGRSMRTASNNSGGSCSFVAIGTGTESTLSMPPGSTVERAYVYWAGSGEEFEADDTVSFGLTGSEVSITADDMFYIDNVGGAGTLDFFAGYKDVTSSVSINGDYTLFNLNIQSDAPWSNTEGCAGGWALVVVYSNANERFRVANLFHGFQPFQNSSITLVPRNFRMATTDNPGDTPGAGYLPNGEVTHITVEGDETLATGDESLGIQDGPGLETFTSLNNSFNPSTADFNSTVSRPIFALDGGTGFYEFQSTAGVNGDGYEIDNDPGFVPGIAVELGDSWGFDIDTHYIAGNDSSGKLWNFAQLGAEAEEITTRYSSGQDLVLLLSEVITVTNFDLADLEIFKSEVGAFKVGGTGTYQFMVSNNGNNGIVGGEATGQVLVADVLPAGLTLASVSGTDWDCSVTAADAFSCVFDIDTDCTNPNGCAVAGELATGEFLPIITASINIGDTSFFPLISNNVKNVARLQANTGNCPALVAGVIPDPDDCDRPNQFDNVNDLEGGAIDINDLDDKTSDNNNVDSVIIDVRGVETDLGITKVVNGVLEEGSTGSYTITVTNFGPDDTTGGAGGTITVTDAVPAGVTFVDVSGAGWTCSGGGSDEFPCTYGAVLPLGSSATLTLNVTVTGANGQNVTNTAAVSSGTFNFDSNSGNDSDTDITAISPPLVSSGEKFLISVSVPGDSTQIGGLGAFTNDDYIVYDPLIDTGAMFYDNAGEGYNVNDANAVHLYQNGHVAISAETAGSIGSNTLLFQPEDIVVWDPVLKTAVMLFDGSAIFDGPITANQNIDAVYVKDDGRIVFSTAGAASITFSGPTTVNFNQGDIVEYDPSDGSVTILIDASDANIFGGEVQVDSIYIRVDDSDADLNKEVYILSVNENLSTTIGACAGCGPVTGTTLTRDDIVELDLSGADPVTQNLFIGNVPLGVFTSADSDREIDAIHVVEDGYIGHFSISQSQAGSTCEAGQITIAKHLGLTHDIDTDYVGSIFITTDIGEGDWAIAFGSGTLDNGVADDGSAIYTFAPGDNGDVTLFLTEDTVTTINVDVTNHYAGFVGESASEDPNFTFNNVITSVTYKDEFESVSFANNDGTTFFAANWVENDGVAVGPAAGNILISGTQLEMTSTVGDPNPDFSRVADLSVFAVSETVFLNFEYAYQFLNSGSDVLEVQARANSGDAFTTVQSFSGIGGTNLTTQSVSLNLTTLLGSPTWTSTTEIRFRIAGGYTGTSRMFFDNIELATGTIDCGIGSISHYEIRIDGFTGTVATQIDGISCVGSVVTITGHDNSGFPSASNESITLQTSTGKGDWTNLTGTGILDNGALGDGIATYTFFPGEQSASFIFNYTSPSTDGELVNFNIVSAFTVDNAEDPTLKVNQAGLIFYDETNNTSTNPIPMQIAGKASNVGPGLRLITIEGVRTSDENPLACSPLFDVGNTLSIGFAGECQNPATCSALVNPLSINGTAMQPAPDNAGSGTTASMTDINILMVDQGAGHVGGEVWLNYVDAGQIQLHAQYEIPLGNNLLGVPSTDFLSGSSNAFVVRPFGFDIDFSDDRGVGGGVASVAADANGPAFARAGAGFDATISAVIYDASDDVNSDGVPDFEADLSDNAITPNFGQETVAEVVLVSVITDDPNVVGINDNPGVPGGVVGAIISGEAFANFSGGQATQSITIDEVGIFDLQVDLVDNALDKNLITYLGSENVSGGAANLGRIYPSHFEFVSASFTPRVNQGMAAACTASSFTYMGEEFGINLTIQAKNTLGTNTLNYIGDFAKLISDTQLDFGAIIDVNLGMDIDLDARLVNPGPVADFGADWINGSLLISRNLIISRPAGGVEEIPLVGVQIVFSPFDDNGDGVDGGIGVGNDVSLGVFDVDLDDGIIEPGTNVVKLVATHDFRYGRLLLDNAFGPETEPLGIPLRIEYYSDSGFEVNTDDSCTTLFYDIMAATPALDFVASSYEAPLADGDTTIEDGELLDVTITVFEGQTNRTADGDDDDENDQDRPFFTSAPDALADSGITGRVIVEFDLNNSTLPTSLDFLAYDWRGDAGEVDDYDEIPDGIYTDNPRSVIEFGSYRGHDRVINWQEIYIGPGP